MFEILNPTGGDRVRWLEIISRLPEKMRDPLISPDYLAAEQELFNQPALAVLDLGGDRVIVKPFVTRNVIIGSHTYGFDICSPQGYGGPYGADPDAYVRFDAAFTNWCQIRGAICEYTALNAMHVSDQLYLMSPLLGSQSSHPVLTKRKNVVWVSFEEGVGIGGTHGYSRNAIERVKLASRSGISVRMSSNRHPVVSSNDDRLVFAKLYREAMERKGAAERWMFREPYVIALCSMGNIFVAEVDGEIEAMALVLGDADSSVAYYHMAASALRSPRLGANGALIDEIIRWCMGNGIQKLHLGGGVTAHDDDTVLAFKASFSPLRAVAMSTFRVFQKQTYRDACVAKAAIEIQQTGAEFTTNFEPLYRREKT